VRFTTDHNRALGFVLPSFSTGPDVSLNSNLPQK
jgi:hypothetical protein